MEVPSGLVGTIYTQSNSSFMGNPYFEKLADFSYVMWICGRVAPCGPSALVATKKASFANKRHAVWQSPLSWDKKLQTFKKLTFFYFLLFVGQKVVFWVEKRCFGVFWSECELANLKQRRRATAMDHRNKIQSLLLPTDDPRDAPDCMCEYGLVPVNMVIYAIH